MIDADYTASGGVGTLTVSTDDLVVATQLRAAFFCMQAAVEAGVPFELTVAVAQ